MHARPNLGSCSFQPRAGLRCTVMSAFLSVGYLFLFPGAGYRGETDSQNGGPKNEFTELISTTRKWGPDLEDENEDEKFSYRSVKGHSSIWGQGRGPMSPIDVYILATLSPNVREAPQSNLGPYYGAGTARDLCYFRMRKWSWALLHLCFKTCTRL